jgi:hypothetical protein
MGLFNKNKKEKQEIIEKKGWINVKFVFYLDGKTQKKEIAKECLEIIEIFMNGQSNFDDKGNFLGYANPKINKEASFLVNRKVKGIYSKGLHSLFVPEFKKTERGWKITCFPNGKDGKKIKYKINDLYEDLYILWQLDKDFRERYGIGEGTQASFDTNFIGKKPIVIKKEKTIIMDFKVEDRIKYDDNDLAEKIFGDTFYSQFKAVKKNKPSRKLTKKEKQERERWLEEVSKLLEKEKK